MITTADFRDQAVPVGEKMHHLVDAIPHPSEIFWFVLSFVLFLVMGPFAAPVALLVVFTSPKDENAPEPEPVEDEERDFAGIF